MAVIEATGPVAHVALLREHAASRQVDLDRLEAPDEAAVYRALDLPFLPPEVRDGTDEIAAAIAGIDRLIVDLRDALGITVVVVSHEVNSIRRTADRVTMLLDGKVMAEGTIAEIEQSPDPRVSGFFRGTSAPAQRVPADLFTD